MKLNTILVWICHILAKIIYSKKSIIFWNWTHTFSSETSRDFKLLPTTRSSSSSSTILLNEEEKKNEKNNKIYRFWRDVKQLHTVYSSFLYNIMWNMHKNSIPNAKRVKAVFYIANIYLSAIFCKKGIASFLVAVGTNLSLSSTFSSERSRSCSISTSLRATFISKIRAYNSNA